MNQMPRREFLQTAAAAAGAALVPAASAPPRFAGIQVGAVSFVDEGVEPVLDRFQKDGAVTALLLATFTYGRGIAGRQVPGQPFPDHGKRESDESTFHGGNYASVHERFYKDTPLKKTQAPDFPGFDLLDQVVPKAKARQIKSYCWYEDVFRRDIDGVDQLQETTLAGPKASSLCFNNPGTLAFWLALTEDFVRSYPVDGIMWGSERQGPFGNAIGASHGGGASNPASVSCFCNFCLRAGKMRGIDPERAKEGYLKLAQLVARTRKGDRPADGYFVSFWRLLVQYPEIIAWEKLWNDGQKKVYAEIYSLAKSIRPGIEVGWHIWHNNSFSPFYRAEQDYAEFSQYSDFLKVVIYNNCAGPRLASYIHSVSRTIFADFAPASVTAADYRLLNYDEKPLSEIARAGLSSDYVYRETKRAVDGVSGHVKIYPGIDIDIPTGQDEKKTGPDDVREAVNAAFRGGAHGVILSRKYSEMQLKNLRAAGDVLRT
jgi:hypothetical protein